MKSALTFPKPPLDYVTDRFKAVVLVLFLFCVALWFLLRGVPCWVLPCSLFSCFFLVLSACIVINSLEEERAGLCGSHAFVVYVASVDFALSSLAFVGGVWLWLWHFYMIVFVFVTGEQMFTYVRFSHMYIVWLLMNSLVTVERFGNGCIGWAVWSRWSRLNSLVMCERFCHILKVWSGESSLATGKRFGNG